MLTAAAGRVRDAESFREEGAKPEDRRGERIFNVRDFGAKGDGKVLDTAAIQAAVDACHGDGGGTVLIPQGEFHSGTIELKSNVTLRVSASGKLLGSADGKQYHPVSDIPLSGDSTLEDGNWALVFATDAKNVTVEGPGVIDGQGIEFHSAGRGVPPRSGLGGNKRPYSLLFYRCENLRVRDIDLIRSAYHCVRVIQSTRVHMSGLYIHNRVNGNNDGFHFISCRHVTVSNCIVESQDDACALFGSCQFVTITNSSFSTRWSVFRFGGGVAENITVSNCVLYQVYGCPIKFHGGPGSRFENISFSDLVLQDATGPINISVGPPTPRKAPGAPPGPQAAGGQPGTSRVPALARNISFSNIQGTVTTNPGPLPDYPFGNSYRQGEGHSCITLNCVGDAVLENISFTNVHLTFGGGGTAEDAARRDLPAIAGEYFMLGPMPAYGLYARHSRGLTLQNVRFQVSRPDLRPSLILDHVEDAAIQCLNVEGNTEAESCLRFIDTKQVLMTATRLLTAASVFLQLEGAANEAITIDGGDLSKAETAVRARNGATEQAVKRRI
ncbi:MAG: right-handed parallel beta-helix repeat-containing protein [Acidobacteriaceae bacterium]|nr:right-handed parallel beta-helix repeat-containing protein [Acidobacteriaceae bacterium]